MVVSKSGMGLNRVSQGFPNQKLSTTEDTNNRIEVKYWHCRLDSISCDMRNESWKEISEDMKHREKNTNQEENYWKIVSFSHPFVDLISFYPVSYMSSYAFKCTKIYSYTELPILQ